MALKRQRHTSTSRRSTADCKLRRGWGMLDLFVAFTLLAATITVVTPLIVRHGRLLESQRHYRIALEELTSQLDRLTVLSAEQLSSALKALKPSEFVAERMPGAEIAGTLTPIEGGERITLSLAWSAPGRHDAPVSLSGWVFPRQAAVNASDGGQL